MLHKVIHWTATADVTADCRDYLVEDHFGSLDGVRWYRTGRVWDPDDVEAQAAARRVGYDVGWFDWVARNKMIVLSVEDVNDDA